MSFRLTLVALLVVGAASTGCRSRASGPPAADGSAPPAPTTAGTGAAASDGSGAPPVEAVANPLDAQTMTPESFATALRDAVARYDRAAAHDALRALGVRLSEWRREPPAPVVAALQDFAAEPYAQFRSRIDGRFVPPAVELLLTARDYAAVLRLAAEFDDSPGAPALTGPEELARQEATRAPAEIRSVGCIAQMDGHAITPAPAGAAPGTYTLRCTQGGQILALTLVAGQSTTVDWGTPRPTITSAPMAADGSGEAPGSPAAAEGSGT
jgi:hypothetical protein